MLSEIEQPSTTIKVLQLFSPFFYAMLGSLLTILGSLYLKKYDARQERRKLLREKLEELYFQLYELDKWVSNAGRIAVSFGAGKISLTKGTPVEDSPIVRIDMLARFYFHSLRSYSDPLSAAVENFRKTLFNFYADILEGKQKPDDNRYLELIGMPAQEIEKLRLQLLKELEKEVRKYI